MAAIRVRIWRKERETTSEINWSKITSPLGEAAEKLRAAAEEAEKARDQSGGTLRRDLALIADEGLDLYQQAHALKLRTELERSAGPPG